MKMSLKIALIIVITVLSFVIFSVSQTGKTFLQKTNSTGLSGKKNSEKPWEPIFSNFANPRLKEIGYPILKEKTLSPGSKEIRVWTHLDPSPSGIFLEYDNSNWRAIYLPPNNSNKYDRNSVTELNEPKSGWNKLIEKLNSLNIEEIPDMAESGIEFRGYDSRAIVIEVKNQEGYRNYLYQGLEFDRISKLENPKKVIEICLVLSEEFGLDLAIVPEVKTGSQ